MVGLQAYPSECFFFFILKILFVQCLPPVRSLIVGASLVMHDWLPFAVSYDLHLIIVEKHSTRQRDGTTIKYQFNTTIILRFS